MGKLRAFRRLLRSCLFFSGGHNKRRSNKQEATAIIGEEKKLIIGRGNNNHDDDKNNPSNGDGDGDDTVFSPATVVVVADVLSLPDDIIFDVLSRLPVKTLCRLKCVSKAWRALISDPAFASARAAATAAPLVVGVFRRPRPLDKLYPVRPPGRFFINKSLELRLMDSSAAAATAGGGGSNNSNNVVLRVVKDIKSMKLLSSTGLGDGHLVLVDQGMHGARVIDPATGRVMVLGGPAKAPYTTTTSSTTTLYNSNGTTGAGSSVYNFRLCHYSLGRATPSGAYKVVCLHDGIADNRSVQTCHVATLEWPPSPRDDDDDDDGIVMDEEPPPPTCWRQRPEPPVMTCPCSSCTATIDGVVHFMNHGPPDRSRYPGHFMSSQVCIASFDLESEEWEPRPINGPPLGSLGNRERWNMALAVLKGSLCLVQAIVPYYSGDPGRCMNVWFLVVDGGPNEEESVWVKQYTIQMPQTWRVLRPLEVLVDGRMLMLNTFLEEEGGDPSHSRCVLQLYNPGTGAHTDLMEMGHDFLGPLTLYTGSLLSDD